MIIPEPMLLRQIKEPFDHPDWIYEIQHDGFRALAVIEKGKCRFISKNQHTLSGFKNVSNALATSIKAKTAVFRFGSLMAC